MKSFIVAALLVAAVAGQSLDTLKFNKDRALFKFDRELYPTEEKYIHNNNFVQYYGKDFDFFNFVNAEFHVYQYEEIISHPLFREYMTLPLFRQYWAYPQFQKYVTSVFFQRFWEVPAFKQYFVNPTLFYKYIYPIVALFKYEQVTYNTLPFQQQYQFQYPQQQQLNFRNIPTICQYNSIYCKALLEKFYNHFYTFATTYYGQQEEVMTPYTPYTPYMYKYNPFVARYFQKYYYNRYPVTEETTQETFPVEYYNRYPYAYNYQYNKYNKYPVNFEDNTVYNKDMNLFETEKINEVYPAEYNYEHVYYPTMMKGVKNFDKKMIVPETMIKA